MRRRTLSSPINLNFATVQPGRIIAWLDFGGLISHAHVLQIITLWSERIMPEF